MDNNAQKPRVLYVEDDRQLASLYGERLRQEGYQVEYCSDGNSAIQLGRQFKPDLILVDLMMPTLSGFDAIERFRAQDETAHAKIIVLSALSQPEDIEKAKRLGADDYFVKSQMLIDDIMIRIRRHLGLVIEPAAYQLPDPGGTGAAS